MNANAMIHTLGCRLNSADSALLVSRLQTAGYQVVAECENAALIVVNTCAVTAEATRKSRQCVRKFRQHHPQATIVVTGCSAELDQAGFLREGGADIVITNPEKREIVRLILEYVERQRPIPAPHPVSLTEPATTFREDAVGNFPFRSRAFLKIQEGCDNYCSYCIVPYVRGHERSRDFDEVLSDCRHAVEAGFPELVLTGVNTCAYQDRGRDLGALVRAIAGIDGEFRIRLSSTEPYPDNRTLLEVMAAEPKVCRFLHLALQHGNDRVLRAMNRHYTRAQYAAFVERARQLIPDIHIGSDLIVGFPGETEAEFQDSRDFVRQMAFANLHLFTYSPREGTPAARMPDQVPGDVARRRYQELAAIAETSHRAFQLSQSGKTLPVIFETVDSDGFAKGWSDNYLEVRMPAAEVPLDRITPVAATARNLGLEPPSD